jgi:hypothetical protein
MYVTTPNKGHYQLSLLITPNPLSLLTVHPTPRLSWRKLEAVYNYRNARWIP